MSDFDELMAEAAQVLLFAISGSRDRWAAEGNGEKVAECDAAMRKCAAMMDRWDKRDAAFRAREALT